MLRASGNTRILEVEGLLDYKFNNKLLLLEACTHSGFKHSQTASCSKLASLGTLLFEILITKELDQKTSLQLCTSNVNAAEHAVGWVPCEEDRKWPSLSGDASYEFGIHPVVCVQELVDACNNNVAYAYACVCLGLHDYVLTSSSKLQAYINSFVHFAKFDHGSSLLTALIQQDAPRILGQVFAAAGAAVFIDSGWDSFD